MKTACGSKSKSDRAGDQRGPGPGTAHASMPWRLAGGNLELQDYFLQRKLVVGSPGDPYEREADAVAERVAGGPARLPASAPGARAAGMAAGAAGLPRPTGQSGARAAAGLAEHPGSGSPLDRAVRARIEPVLGADLSGVRVHGDPRSRRVAAGINARAFTHGSHIHLGPGAAATDAPLMAHESTHAVQQSASNLQGRVQRDETDTGPAGETASHLPDPMLEAAGLVDWNALDVAAYTNGELLEALRSNQAWLDGSGMVALEFFDRQGYQDRLTAEKRARVEAGSVWLEDPGAETTASVIVLSNGGDRVQVSAFAAADYLSATGAPSGSRVMSQAQFQDFLRQNGIPTFGQEEWADAETLIERREAEEGPGDDLSSLAAMIGASVDPTTAPRYGRQIGDRYARGFVDSGAHGTVAEAMFGARRGGLDLNSAWWADARLANQPFQGMFPRLLQRYGPFMMRRPFAQGPSFGMTGPRPGWFDSGAGWQRGNYPMADFDAYDPRAIAPTSVKSSLRPDWASRRDFFLEGHAAMVGTDRRTGGGSLDAYLRNAPTGTTQADVARTGVLAINPEDVSRLRDVYRSLTAVEAPYQEDGRTVTPETMSLARAGVRRVIDGYLRASGPVTINGQQYATVDSLLAAYNDGNGTITLQQLDAAVRPLGEQAASALRSNETPRALLEQMRQSRMAHGPGTRRALEVLGTSEHFGNLAYGTPRATGLSMARGGRSGALIGAGLEAFQIAMNPDDYDDPMGAIFEAGGMGFATGAVESGLEHQFASHTASRVISSGAPLTVGQALWLRSLSAARAGGIVSAGVEGISILSEDRNHSAQEVIARVGRAGGIGYVSAMAGAAIGTAIGGPVGFIVGLGVGIAVGAILDWALPRYDAESTLQYRREVGQFMATLEARSLGHTAHTLGPDGEESMEWVPPDPRYAAYAGTLERWRSGESGACQTCHEISIAWQETADTWGSPMPTGPTFPQFDAFPIPREP